MNSTNPESIRLLRDVDAYMVPSGDEVKLLAGNLVRITQALGGNYTVIMNGNMVQIRAENADALGIEVKEQEKTEQLIQQDQSNFPDSLDRAAKEEEFMLELRKRERERKLIAKIDLSLKDLEDNLYGYCESCGVEIGIKRLEARPTATKCIDCKTVDEIKEKQQFG